MWTKDAFERVRGERPLPAVFESLWACGNVEVLARPTIAVVGTRSATAYGKALARRFAADLGAAGCCILSGLALGIDGAAHEGALDAGAPTCGILGSGHARFFPARNRTLAQRMIDAGGLVLSPYPPDTPAQPWQFLERNGIVAALSDAVVVIEAPARSGALNTASWAAGRIPVFAVPGDVDRAHVAGCHALIRDGAILARNARDVLDDLSLPKPPPPRASQRHPPEERDALQVQLLDLLAAGEATLDELIANARAEPPAVFAALTMLELSGAIESRPGLRYALRR